MNSIIQNFDKVVWFFWHQVRATLEKVRKKMYGEYDEMKRKIQQLTNELKVSTHSFTGKAYGKNCPSVI